MVRKDIKKRLEQFKRTQDINKIVEKGNIESQALLESAGEDRPVEASHAYDLISENDLVLRKEVGKETKKKKAIGRVKRKTKARKARKKRPRHS